MSREDKQEIEERMIELRAAIAGLAIKNTLAQGKDDDFNKWIQGR